jgi:outer membrane protein assembly factor BamB
MPGPGPDGVPVGKWTYPQSEGIDDSVTVAGNLILLSSWGKQQLSAIDAETGKVIWSAAGSYSPSVSPAVSDRRVYAAILAPDQVSGSKLVALDQDNGKELWSLDLGTAIVSGSLTVADERVFFMASDGKVRAVDGKSGAVLWAPDLTQLRAYPGPGGVVAVAHGYAYVVGPDELLYAIEVKSGLIQWTHEVDGEIEISSPVVANGSLLVPLMKIDPVSGSLTPGLHIIDAKTGDEARAPIPFSSWSSIAVAGKTVIAAGKMQDDSRLAAFDIETGGMLWEFDTPGRFSQPIIVGDEIYASNRTNGISYRIDIKTGRSDWSVYLGQATIVGVTHGMAIAASYDTLYAVAGVDAGVTNGTPVSLGADLSGLALCRPPRSVPETFFTGVPAYVFPKSVYFPASTETGAVVADEQSALWPAIAEAELAAAKPIDGSDSAIIGALDRFIACEARPESKSQLLGFFTDDFFRRGIVPFNGERYELTWQIQPKPDELARMQTVALPDGRTGVYIPPAPGGGLLVIFRQVDDQLLIDELYRVEPGKDFALPKVSP